METSTQPIKAFSIEPEWDKILSEELSKPYMYSLRMFLEKEERENKVIYPPNHLIFQAFTRTPYSKVKVVIVGQDPYHNPKQAQGLSFSVSQGVTPPPSLKNIFKELATDLGIKESYHGSLLKWADQGVLLLNATLTVQAHKPLSHHNKGWEQFTDVVIEKLAEREQPLVFILWGKNAQEKFQKVHGLRAGHHLVLTAAHPSPYSAQNGFFGCKHFSKTNEFLIKKGITPIDWSLT